jgi:WD40 repeat protein
MNDASVINIPAEIAERYDKIIHIIENDKNSIIDKPPHNDKSITKMEISPNGKYLVIYSENDGSIVGWNINKDIDEGQLKPEITVKAVIDQNHQIKQICVSDDKKLAYIYVYKGWNCLSKYLLLISYCDIRN